MCDFYIISTWWYLSWFVVHLETPATAFTVQVVTLYNMNIVWKHLKYDTKKLNQF
jgi:hypothetical protein